MIDKIINYLNERETELNTLGNVALWEGEKDVAKSLSEQANCFMEVREYIERERANE